MYTLKGLLVVVEDVDQEEKHHWNVKGKGQRKPLHLSALPGLERRCGPLTSGGQSTCMPEEDQSGGEASRQAPLEHSWCSSGTGLRLFAW